MILSIEYVLVYVFVLSFASLKTVYLLCFLYELYLLCFLYELYWLCVLYELYLLCVLYELVLLCFLYELYLLCFLYELYLLCFLYELYLLSFLYELYVLSFLYELVLLCFLNELVLRHGYMSTSSLVSPIKYYLLNLGLNILMSEKSKNMFSNSFFTHIRYFTCFKDLFITCALYCLIDGHIYSSFTVTVLEFFSPCNLLFNSTAWFVQWSVWIETYWFADGHLLAQCTPPHRWTSFL